MCTGWVILGMGCSGNKPSKNYKKWARKEETVCFGTWTSEPRCDGHATTLQYSSSEFFWIETCVSFRRFVFFFSLLYLFLFAALIWHQLWKKSSIRACIFVMRHHLQTQPLMERNLLRLQTRLLQLIVCACIYYQHTAGNKCMHKLDYKHQK